jgi:hypothetical protein
MQTKKRAIFILTEVAEKVQQIKKIALSLQMKRSQYINIVWQLKSVE